jgi:hypothetical protein
MIPVVMVAVVLGAAVPALMAAAQLVALPAAQLAALTPVPLPTIVVPGTTVDLAGTLVDSACYLRAGRAAISVDHAKCAITCAQKGGRLALVTAQGDVFMVIGTMTQSNNAKLIPLINRSIVLSGMVRIRLPDVLPLPVLSRTDTRRQTIQDAIVTLKTVRLGDFREGDLPDAPEMTIEPTAFKLLLP